MDAFFQFTKLSTFQCIPISLSFFLCIYQSFLSTYKDIIGKLSIHHIMFFAYGSSKRKWKPFLLLSFYTTTTTIVEEKGEKFSFANAKNMKMKSIMAGKQGERERKNAAALSILPNSLISIIFENNVVVVGLHIDFFSFCCSSFFGLSPNDVTNIMGSNLI